MRQVNISSNPWLLVDCRNRTETNCVDDLIAGSIMAAYGTISLIFYLFILIVLARSSKLTHVCYKFMFSMGVGDCMALLVWIVTGIFTATHGSFPPEPVFYALFQLTQVGLEQLIYHNLLITFNRYVAICKSQWHGIFFNQNRHYLWICTVWILSIVFSIPSFFPPGEVWIMEGYFQIWSNWVEEYYTVFDPLSLAILMVTLIFCNFSIIFKYRMIKTKVHAHSPGTMTTTASSHNSLSHQKKVEASKELKRQFRIAMQCAMMCVFECVWGFLWYTPGWMGNNIWFRFFYMTFLWIVNHGLHPMVYLIFNKEIRKAVWHFLRYQSFN